MAQGERTPKQQVWFDHNLMNVNLLYLGARVLILLDGAYLSRFWCLFESWLALQHPSASGLSTAALSDRCTVVPLPSAAGATTEVLKTKGELAGMWEGKSAEDVHELLSRPDVHVTNAADRRSQLPKLLKLEEAVCEQLNVLQRRDDLEEELTRLCASEPLAVDLERMEATLTSAQEGQVSPAVLERSREAWRVASEEQLGRATHHKLASMAVTSLQELIGIAKRAGVGRTTIELAEVQVGRAQGIHARRDEFAKQTRELQQRMEQNQLELEECVNLGNMGAHDVVDVDDDDELSDGPELDQVVRVLKDRPEVMVFASTSRSSRKSSQVAPV